MKKYKHAGKYFLDVIDGVLYSTDSYEVFNYYNALFNGTYFGYPDGYIGYQEKKKSKEKECIAMATPEAWKKGIEQEIRKKRTIGKIYRHLHRKTNKD